MTREEAIEEVKNYDNYPNGLSKECRDYIIKALEQETVSKEVYDHEYFLRKEFEMKIAKLEQQEPILDKVKQAREKIENLTPWDEGLVEMYEVLAILDKLIESEE